MQDNIARQECVLSDVGKIYVGTHNKPVGRPWVFGQVYLWTILYLKKSRMFLHLTISEDFLNS